MKRLIIVYSPRSARFSEVQRKVLQPCRDLKGWTVLKFEVEEAPLKKNAKNLAKLIKKDDLVISAGGDGTAAMSMNAIMESGKTAVLAVMPFGNFNDYAETLGRMPLERILRKFEERKYDIFYPLDVRVDGEHLMYAGSYFTIGMMAEASLVLKGEKVRKKLRKARNRMFFSGRKMFVWYMKNKWRRVFLPGDLKLNGQAIEKNTTDYVAVNGKSIACVVPCKGWFENPSVFWSGTMKNKSLMRMFGKFLKTLDGKLPGGESEGDLISFKTADTVYLHCDGEGERVSGVLEIEIKKAKNGLRVIQA